MKYIFLFPLIVILFILFSTVASTSTDDVVNQTCQDSSKSDPNINFTFCSAALNSASRAATSGGGADLNQLGLIAMTLVKSNCSNTKHLIMTMLNTTTVTVVADNRTRAALKDCSELYSDADPTIREAVRVYKARRYGDANIKVSAVLDGSATCEQGFQDVGVVSPLSRENNHVFQLSAIALSIINKLGKY